MNNNIHLRSAVNFSFSKSRLSIFSRSSDTPLRHLSSIATEISSQICQSAEMKGEETVDHAHALSLQPSREF
jgi:hypothetical protein